MSLLDEWQEQWNRQPHLASSLPNLDPAALASLVRTRARRQINRAMQYFWGAFVLQIIVYALLSHVWIRSWGEPHTQWLCVAGILLYLPFTVMLLSRFKKIARASPGHQRPGDTVQRRIKYQYQNLVAFYRFKKRYEYLLIPTSTALGIYLIFRLYVPGGAEQHVSTAAWLFGLTLLSCVWAIRRENRNQFRRPIKELRLLLNEFEP